MAGVVRVGPDGAIDQLVGVPVPFQRILRLEDQTATNSTSSARATRSRSRRSPPRHWRVVSSRFLLAWSACRSARCVTAPPKG